MAALANASAIAIAIAIAIARLDSLQSLLQENTN
jgi:hypothetical protein